MGARPQRDGTTRERTARGGAGRTARDGDAKRDDARAQRRRPADDRPSAPPIPDEIQYSDLPKQTRARLRTLSKANAEDVGRHLLMAGLLLDEDPELAYQHAQVALSRGGRVDVVREAAAVAAYATGRYAEALREFRTVRRLNGSDEHLPAMADCERGLGRPERAIALAREAGAQSLPADLKAEMQIVVAGARLDLGEADAAVATLEAIAAPDDDARLRVKEALAGAYRAAGRDDDAARLEAELADWLAAADDDEDVLVFDTADEDATEEQPAPGASATETQR